MISLETGIGIGQLLLGLAPMFIVVFMISREFRGKSENDFVMEFNYLQSRDDRDLRDIMK